MCPSSAARPLTWSAACVPPCALRCRAPVPPAFAPIRPSSTVLLLLPLSSLAPIPFSVRAPDGHRLAALSQGESGREAQGEARVRRKASGGARGAHIGNYVPSYLCRLSLAVSSVHPSLSTHPLHPALRPRCPLHPSPPLLSPSLLSPAQETHQLADVLGLRLDAWQRMGKGNIRAYLTSVQDVLWEGNTWTPITLMDLVSVPQVRKAWNKARFSRSDGSLFREAWRGLGPR